MVHLQGFEEHQGILVHLHGVRCTDQRPLFVGNHGGGIQVLDSGSEVILQEHVQVELDGFWRLHSTYKSWQVFLYEFGGTIHIHKALFDIDSFFALPYNRETKEQHG